MATELYIESGKIDLKEGESVAITYQANDLADLKDRQASHTNTIKAPKTIGNRAALDNCDDIHSTSRYPYSKKAVRLLCGGVDVVEDGVVFVNAASQEFELSIYSAVTAVFELIGNKKLSDLDFSDIVLPWTFTEVVNGWGRPNGIMGKPYTFGALDDGLNYPSIHRDIDVKTCYPMIFVSEIIKRIFSSVGFSVQSTAFNQQRYIDSVIPFTNSEIITTNNSDYQGVDSFRAVLNALTFNLIPTSPNYRPFYFADISTVGWQTHAGSYNTGTGQYTSPQTGTGVFYFRGFVQVLPNTFGQIGRDISLACVMYINGFPVQSLSKSNDDGLSLFDLQYIAGKWVFEYDVEFTQAVNVGDIVQFVFVGGNSVTNIYPNDFKILSYHPATLESDYAYTGVYWKFDDWNAIWDISKNLPDIAQKDFLKAIMQMYCLTPVVDSRDKVVNLIPFDQVAKNEMKAQDWSDYLAESVDTIEQQFHATDYAQQNWFKYKEDSTLDDSTFADSSFSIGDNTLQLTKDIVKLPFAPTENTTTLLSLRIGQVRRFDKDGKAVTPQPRILCRKSFTVLVGSSNVWLLEPDAALSSNGTTMSTAYLYDPNDTSGNDLRWPALLKDNYNGIRSVLSAYRKCRMKVILPSKAFKTITFEVPVYFSQLGAIFYVNKVENWQDRKVIVAELIKL